MGEFLVSARKYRPATFASVVGQSAITTTLKNAVLQNQVAQAFLFCGPRGVGKTTCARILAKTINCTHRTADGEACNECESCQSFNQSASFNIFELDAASNSGVDDIKNLIDQVRIPPQGAEYKVYIIDEVHMLSSSAFNAFLKTLEEPPAYAKFILATTEKHKIIPTILSRCQVFDFKRITTEDIAQHLAWVAQKEQVSYEESALHLIAQKADGGLRDALSIFDQEILYTSGDLAYQKVAENLNVLDANYYISLTDMLYQGDIAQALVTYNEILDRGFDGQQVLDGICHHLRNLMVCRSPISIKLLDMGEQLSQAYAEQVKRTDPLFLLHALDVFNRCSGSYKTANNRRLHVEVALMMICKNQLKGMTVPTSNAAAQPAKNPVPAPNAQAQAPANRSTTQAQPMPNAQAPVPAPDAAAQPAVGHTHAGKTTSIKNLMATMLVSPEQDEKKKDEPLIPTIAADKANAMTTEEAAHYCMVNWKELLEEFGDKNLAAISLLSDKSKIAINDHQIVFSIANTVAEKSIQEVLKNLLTGIWEKTGIHYQASFRMDEQTTHVPIINPEERFAKLKEQNSYLQEFKDTFKLSVK